MPDGPSRLVGVLGGMGPAATVDFYDKLVRLTPATVDQDHVRVVIWADPTVPSRQDAFLREGPDPSPALREGIGHLVGCGAEIVVSPCNTVHAILPGIMAEYPVEFISIVDATLDAAEAAIGGGVAGLLATDAALAAHVYQDALRARGYATKIPSSPSQASLMKLVDDVKGGRFDAGLHARFRALLEDLAAQGVSTVIAACTELSTLIHGSASPDGLTVIDPAVALAEATIQRAKGLATV